MKRWQKLYRLMKLAYRYRTFPIVENVPRQEMEKLLFGQYNVVTQQFFQRLYGSNHTILLPDFPHYRLLESHLENPFSDNIFQEYLKNNWDHLKRPNEKSPRDQHIQNFIARYELVCNRIRNGAAAFDVPLVLCRRPDGYMIIVDGNHRASIALKLGLDCPAIMLSPHAYLKRITGIKGEFYGAGRLGMPYQSIFMGEEELVRGRRGDILTRIRNIFPEDLKNKTVLDLGCNLGANCFSSVDHGARCAIGVDYSNKLINSATKLNGYLAKDVQFMVHDLSTDVLDIDPADTVLCFSLVHHLKEKDSIVTTIRNLTRKVLYFEGHSRTGLDDYSYLLNSDNFASIELLGHMQNSRDRVEYTRPLFRCTVHEK